jgi:UDP-N-acetylmuramate: L-alanyl-gamma-D-glutamyl-meso-diaminopimelate ligase
VVGNALSRGNPAVEQVLDDGRNYTSGAQWLAETSCPAATRSPWQEPTARPRRPRSSPTCCSRRREPGFLIGGVAEDFGVSARIGTGREFVVEADEYDTAFFDKRSKFVHYRRWSRSSTTSSTTTPTSFPTSPRSSASSITFVRTVPAPRAAIVNGEDAHLSEVLAMGCWTPVETFGLDASLLPATTTHEAHGDRARYRCRARDSFDWTARLLAEDGSGS